ncbi:type I restriction-modification system subunit M [Corallibacter sp.]|uniref:type I restriction-modification system subunit M n=1 Tax=Corallibacter sp. TaxID=2038084 RepID=UPI003A8F5EC6
MNNKVHNQIVSFIWSIADDVLRDDFVRGKYRDIILPFTVLRRLDALLVPTKEDVLKGYKFLKENKIDDLSGLTHQSGYPFFNTSGFTFSNSSLFDSNHPYTALTNDPANIDSNLEEYLDGFSENIQQIIDRFEIRKQLPKLKENGLTPLLIEKLASKEINLSPVEIKNTKGEVLPPLTNLGMGYVFEELIRKFNEENNEEAGEHFTPREIIQLMTHLIFLPIKDKLKVAQYSIYDSACGSGGMLTEAEKYAKRITKNKTSFSLYGQEVNPETWAVCNSDMLIKGEKDYHIAYGSTLSNDSFQFKEFDFMLSNPPYGKAWKKDEDSIVIERGKTNELIKDPRFQTGLPKISDGQLLFLSNMVHKMKKGTELGSRIASVHNGSSLFTGNAGQGESEIRRYLIESDLVECIVALPEKIFYNTGIPTYIWILSNRKEKRRQGKIQLINALELSTPLRRNLGEKNCEMQPSHIKQIEDLYLNFKETNISKVFDNEDFGYYDVTIERPLRYKSQFTNEAIENLRYLNTIADEMKWMYAQFGDNLYEGISKEIKQKTELWLKDEDIKISTANKKKLFNNATWKTQKELMHIAKDIFSNIGDKLFDNFNLFNKEVDKVLKTLSYKVSVTNKKKVLLAVSWKDEEAEPVIKKKEKNGTIIYEADSDLRDTEIVPLNENIEDYFNREVIPYVPDAWINYDKITKGYMISFTRYFYNYSPPKDLELIKQEILDLEKETEGILEEIIKS